MRLLVADDDPVSRLILRKILSQAGHEVVLAGDGKAAWDSLQQADAPKLAVLDWSMPELDGLEVIRKARAYFPVEPVYGILLTAHDNNEDMVRALEAGADDYLTKPVNPLELLARLQVGVRTIQLQSSLARQLSESRFLASIVESSDDAIIGVNLDGSIASWNRGAERLYGYPAEEVIGRPKALLVPPDRSGELPRLLEEVGKGVRILTFESKRLAKDGRRIDVSLTISPIKDDRGKAIRAVVVAHDITERKQAEEALRISESRYRMLFERNLAGVFRTSPDGRMVDCNQSTAQILGYGSAEEVRRLQMQDIHHSPQARAELLARLMAHRSLTNLELRLRRRDGSPVWVMANVSYVDPGDGAEAFVEGTMVDISDRKRAEETLAEEARIVALRADIGAALIMPGTLRQGLQRCTDALVARTGVALARVWTMEYLANILVLEASSGLYTHLNGPHGSVPVGEFKIGRIAQTRQPHLTNDVQNDPEVSDRDCAKREGMVSFVGHPLLAADRQVVGVIGAFGREPFTESTLLAFSSIADQIAQFVHAKRAEQAMLQSEERAKLLFATIPHAAYVFDLETLDFLEVNDVAVERYGYSREELMRMKTTGIRPPQEARALEDHLRQQTQSSNTFAGQWKQLTRSGCIIDVEINFHLLRYAGRPAALIIAQDVTERNKLEIELRHAQKLEAVGGLASGIAHEINTPIQFVGDNIRFLQDGFKSLESLIRKFQELKGAAETGSVAAGLLQEVDQAVENEDLHYLTEEIPKALNQSLDGAERVATIVRAMKDFAHPEQSHKAAADLNKALASTLIVARNAIKYVADVTTDFGDLPFVECCLGDLNQVFLNLLVNAAHAIEDKIKGTGKKGVIRIQTRDEGDHVKIAIGDTGSGIPEAIREKVFEPFFTTKTVGRGTGQGLAISRTIVVEKHGGTLTFETEIGRGTTFWITLPVSSSARPQSSVSVNV